MNDSDQTPAQASFRRLFLVSTVLLVAAAAVAAVLMLRVFVGNLTPEIERKAAMVGEVISRQVSSALDLGIPFDRLHGMDAFLDRVLADNPDIDHIAVSDPFGKTTYSRTRRSAAGQERAETASGDEGQVRVPVSGEGRPRAMVELGISRAGIESKIYAVVFDMAIVLLVAGLFAFELLSLIFQVSIVGPLSRLWSAFRAAASGDFTTRVAASGQREWEVAAGAWNDLIRRLAEAWQQVVADAESVRATLAEAEIGQRLGRLVEETQARFRMADPLRLRTVVRAQAVAIRAPVFVFIMAEELSRSFLPVFIRDIRDPGSALSPELAVGVTMSAFMLMVAVVTPFAGVIVAKLGVRRMFMIGVVPSALAYLGTAFAASIGEVILWRALAGVGYAVVYIVCQGFVAGAATPQRRAQGMALFMGAVFAAGVCGPALGGVIADQVGPRPTFIVSTGLCLLSLMLIYAQLRQLGGGEVPERRLRLADFSLVVRNPSFVALLLCSAMPAKIALTGVLFYLVPLLLAKLGSTSAEIGRILMIYAGCTALLTPIAARVADRWRLNGWMIALGGMVSGLGMLAILLRVDASAVVIAVLLLGLGHAASIAPQLAVVPEITERECQVLGVTAVLSVFRSIERIGSVIGPLLAAALVQIGGEALAMAAIGAFLIVMSLAYAAFGRPTAIAAEARS
ncbi:MAG: MFS transporter [Alphaproteobacteria bacterium]|nr:MFS transporter [Alphaproteobacteria bacterium]